MVVSGAGVSGVADVSDDIALFHLVSFGETGSVAGEVSVVKDQLLVRIELIDRGAAAFALKEFHDVTICCRQDRRACGRRNVDRVMHAAFGSCLVEGVYQLVWSDAGNGNDQLYFAHKIRRRN